MDETPASPETRSSEIPFVRLQLGSAARGEGGRRTPPRRRAPGSLPGLAREVVPSLQSIVTYGRSRAIDRPQCASGRSRAASGHARLLPTRPARPPGAQCARGAPGGTRPGGRGARGQRCREPGAVLGNRGAGPGPGVDPAPPPQPRWPPPASLRSAGLGVAMMSPALFLLLLLSPAAVSRDGTGLAD